MNSFLYIVAIIFVLAWLLGVVSYGASGLIHLLLVLAVISLLLRLIRGRRSEL